MVQRAQVIDLTRSYLPTDPNVFPQNLINTDKEDGEEKSPPILGYEGYNFLPTYYGYKSYFGTEAKLGIEQLGSRCQHILLFQNPDYTSRLIALCEDGIWIAFPDGTDLRWIQTVFFYLAADVPVPPPSPVYTYDPAIYGEWTWCLIENTLYFYQQGRPNAWKTASGTFVVPEIPAILGGIVDSPRIIQTIVESIGTAGDETDIWIWNDYFLSYQYFIGTDFSTASTLVEVRIQDMNSSIEISITGTPPAGVSDIRVFILDDSSSISYYKDFALSSFPISIPNYTGFVVGNHQPATLDDGTGVPAVPAYNITNTLIISTHTPNFLNMAGQMGIFRAGTRLGFWDSANSTSWSSNLDLTDFTPSIENLAGNTIFADVIGRIVTIRGHGEGFIIYATKSITGVNFSTEGNMLWLGKDILTGSGLAYSQAVCEGQSDSEHFAYTTNGIIKVGKYTSLTGKHEIEWILPELYDLLRESRDPVALRCLQQRYLCFQVIDPTYIYGRLSFSIGVAPPYTVYVPWYIPDNGNSTGTEIIQADKMWNIILQEIGGQSSTKRGRQDNRLWIPLYNTTIDEMDTRYYGWWKIFRPGNEIAGLIDYNNASPFLDTIPFPHIYQADLDTYFDALRPTIPPDADRYGRLRSFTAIRAFPYLYGANTYDNNQSLIYNQIDEWDYFKKHQVENMDTLSTTYTINTGDPLNISQYETINGYTVISRHPIYNYPTSVSMLVGEVITGDGNNEWLITEGPNEFDAKEIILRRTFNKKFEVTKYVSISYIADPILNTWYDRGGFTFDALASSESILNIGTAIIFSTAKAGIITIYSCSSDPSILDNWTSQVVPTISYRPRENIYAIPIGAYYIYVDSTVGYIYTTDGGITWSNGSGLSYPVANTGITGEVFDGGNIIIAAPYFYWTPISGSPPVGTGGDYLTVSGIDWSGISSSAVLCTDGGSLYAVFDTTAGFAIYKSIDRVNWTLIYNNTSYAGTITYIAKCYHVGVFHVLFNFAGSTYEILFNESGGVNLTVTLMSFIADGNTRYMITDSLYLVDSFLGNTTIYARNFAPVLTQNSTLTYDYTEITENAGYSEIRMTITHWDLIEPGLYGDYNLIQRVAAANMTPKVWANHYPNDRGVNRSKLWTHSQYIAQDIANLTTNELNGVSIYSKVDPNGTPYETLDGYPLFGEGSGFTYPGASFLLQQGSIEAVYPTYQGMFAFDLQLKKWGKYRGEYKLLVESTPLNIVSNGSFSYSSLGIDAGILNTPGEIKIFDSFPINSYIRYGKYGSYRLGMTDLLEVKTQFRNQSDGFITIESSLDGKNINNTLTDITPFSNAVEVLAYPDISCRWHTVKISGNWDLTGLELRGIVSGRR